MCGIVGICAFKKDTENKKQVNRREAALYLFTELMLETQVRGKDATGVSALFNDGNFIIQKGGVPAGEFITNFGEEKANYNTFVDTCRGYKEPIKLLLGHCRKSSVGNNTNNSNNHPIRAGEIIGVHNGTLNNHEIIFKKLDCERDGAVDSEAIMRLVEVYTNKCKDPFTLGALTEVVSRLDGAYSVVCFNANNPFQVALMKKARPMELILIRPLGLLIIASEKVFVDKVLAEFNKQARIYKSGQIPLEKKDIDVITFPYDNVGIIDLTKVITENTTVNDVLTKADAFKVPRLWQAPYTATTTTNYNNPNYTRSSYKDTEVKKNTNVGTNNADNFGNTTNGVHKLPTGTMPTVNKAATKKDNAVIPLKGRFFNKDLCKYVDATDTTALMNVPAVVLTNNSADVKILGDTKTEPILVKVNKLAPKTLVSPVPINEIVNTNGSLVQTVKDIVKTTEVNKVVVVTEEEEVTIDTALLNAAKEASTGNLHFSNEEEVAEFLNANSVDILNVLPLNALANRMGAKLYEKAFLDGALHYKELQKSKHAEQAIRITKHVVKLFGKLLGMVCEDKQTYSKPMSLLLEDVGSEMTRDNIKKVFSKGDLVSNPGLIELVKIINAKTNGKDNSSNAISQDGQQ